MTFQEPIVATAAGRVAGRVLDGVNVFKGIPYGDDTSLRRLMAPRPARGWTGTREAFEFGPLAPQPPRSAHPLTTSWSEGGRSVSEDCLVLNVWTPGLGGSGNRPVMVWMHGGAFGAGSGSAGYIDGRALAKLGDVVVVTLNHRLGPFGWLYLAEIGGEEFADSGTAGMLDLVLALQWVKDNIAQFGGDPGNVTIFGESGGGCKVSLLLGMPGAQGLYHKAIIQSGAFLAAAPAARATQVAERFLDDLGLSRARVQEIRTLPMERILAVLGNASTLAKRMAHMPVTDGRNLPRDPFTPDATPLSADIPLLLGNNRWEYIFQFGQDDPTNFQLTWESLPQRLTEATRATGIPGDACDTIAFYRQQDPQLTASDVLFLALSDGRMIANSITLAERKCAQQRGNVFMYRLEWETPVQGGKWRSSHLLDVPLVFNNVAVARSALGEGAGPQQLADTMSAAWVAFARTGSPVTDRLPRWPRYEHNYRSTMILDEPCRLQDDPAALIRHYWTQQRSGTGR